ncbi:MAG: glycosyltransferase family 2 protein [Planctomycetes bacterium]|nr:glycosyltransferase family 2 protein [Planctomycetota bacterium]
MLLSIVIPCYNESEVIADTNDKVIALADQWTEKGLIDSYEIVYIDDGSADSTLDILSDLASKKPNIKVVSFSGNFGHQAALTAGLKYAKGDAIVTLDADLQDPPETIEEMIVKFNEGYQIVYAVRKGRQNDTAFKRLTAQCYYKLMKAMGVNLVYDHADFRLISAKVRDEFARYNEINRFLRGIFPLMGFKHCKVEYDRHQRLAGETKYPLKKMMAFAIDGVTSFSYVPLRLASLLGFTIFLVTTVMIIWVLVAKLFGETVSGWTSTVLPIYAFGGIQLLCIGIVGEYVGKIYMEVKHRPIYIVGQTINIENNLQKR